MLVLSVSLPQRAAGTTTFRGALSTPHLTCTSLLLSDPSSNPHRLANLCKKQPRKIN